jgi:hypothetical protein
LKFLRVRTFLPATIHLAPPIRLALLADPRTGRLTAASFLTALLPPLLLTLIWKRRVLPFRFPAVSERRYCYFLKTAQVRNKGKYWVVFRQGRTELTFL